MQLLVMDSSNEINKLKVVSYNVWFDEECRMERLFSLIETMNAYDPDIICLQEVVPIIFEYLCLCLKKDYQYIFPKKIDGKYHCVVFSKLPISFEEEYEFTNTTMGRKLLSCIVNIKLVKKKTVGENVDLAVENFQFVIASSHFESQFNKYNKVKIEQYIKTKEILEDLSKQYGPVIFCADTNIQQDEEKYYLTCDSNWDDAWVVTGSDKDKEYTYDSLTNDNLKNRKLSKEYRSRIDRIVYTKNNIFKSVHFELIKGLDNFIEPSDHYGTMATFEFFP